MGFAKVGIFQMLGELQVKWVNFLKMFPRGLGNSSKTFMQGSFLEIDIDDGAATQANTPGLV